ncbi:MAG: hypothetical protein J6U54_12150 [Clostridiales bacterium]|nr:hypothetical protein [Clostridiales bacterium]
MEIKKCPNCSGKLDLTTSKKKMVCPFCGSEFAVDKKTSSSTEEGYVEKDWFIYDWNYKKMMETPKLSETVTAFIRTLNEYDSSSQIEEYMRTYLMNYEEISAPGINEDKMEDILKRISGSMRPGERIILYDDDGLFSHGKTGTVVTDQRTIFLEKKNSTEMSHDRVPFLFFDYSFGVPGVKLGNQYGNNIGIFNSHYDLQGTVAALICTMSFEANPDRPKIRLRF